MKEKLVTQLKRHEGFRSYVYDDATGLPILRDSVVEGHPTIGWGRLLTKARGITEEEAALLLRNDLYVAMEDCKSAFPFFDSLIPERQAVLVNMMFNMGRSRLLTFHKMIAALKARDYEEAANQMTNSRWYRQVGVRGQELVQQMKTGEWQF